MQELESFVFDIVRDFIGIIGKKPLESYIDDDDLLYQANYSESGASFGTCRSYSSWKLTKENINKLTEMSSFKNLKNHLALQYNDSGNAVMLKSTFRGFLIKVIDRINPTMLNIEKLQYYLPFLKDELQQNDPLLQSESILLPFRSDIDFLNLGSGVVIRKLFPDEFNHEWFECKSTLSFVDGNMQFADHKFEYTEYSSSKRTQFESGIKPIYPVLRLIESLRIFTGSSVGYARLHSSGGLFRTNIMSGVEITPSSQFLHTPQNRAGCLYNSEVDDFKKFWNLFSVHQLDYIENASRLYTKAMSITDPEVRFLILNIALETLLRKNVKQFEDWEYAWVAYSRMLKILKSMGWNEEEVSEDSLNEIRQVRNNLVHFGQVHKPESQSRRIAIPHYRWVEDICVLVSDCIKSVVGLGPLPKDEMLERIDNTAIEGLTNLLPDWCRKSVPT